MRGPPASICVAACLLLAAPAGAATQLGETFVQSSNYCDPFWTNLQSGSPGSSYAAPFAGVITSWSYQADASPPQVKFKVARSAGGNNFTILAESGLQTVVPSALHTAPIRAPVNDGDIIGIYTTNGECARPAPGPGYVWHGQVGDIPAGTTRSFLAPGAIQVDVSAVLEPDCDGDGFGDETQDASADCAPPETTITRQPKDKTKKKQAEFEFTSSEPGSSFQCSLDGGGFEACVSPLIEKVGKGKHSFQVRATDAVGNVDGSPAVDDWKVKKKK